MSSIITPYYGDLSSVDFKALGETYEVSTIGYEKKSVLEIPVKKTETIKISAKAFGATVDKEVVAIEKVGIMAYGRLENQEHNPLTQKDPALTQTDLELNYDNGLAKINVVGVENKTINWKVIIARNII